MALVAAAGRLQALYCLVGAGADLKARDAEGRTHLALAGAAGQLEAVRALLQVRTCVCVC